MIGGPGGYGIERKGEPPSFKRCHSPTEKASIVPLIRGEAANNAKRHVPFRVVEKGGRGGGAHPFIRDFTLAANASFEVPPSASFFFSIKGGGEKGKGGGGGLE